MKRARIKAIVTVPTRRKATQDISDTEIINTFENSDKNKNVSDDSLQQSSENILHETQEQENLENTKKIIQIQEIEEQVPNEQLSIEQCNEYKSDSMQNSKEEIINIQSSEILNITQISKYNAILYYIIIKN